MMNIDRRECLRVLAGGLAAVAGCSRPGDYTAEDAAALDRQIQARTRRGARRPRPPSARPQRSLAPAVPAPSLQPPAPRLQPPAPRPQTNRL